MTTRHVTSIGCPMLAPSAPPPPERITLRLPPELARRLDERARALGITRSEVVRALVETGLAAREGGEP